MAQGTLCYGVRFMLDLHQMFYNLGIHGFTLHYTSSHDSYGPRLTILGYMWQGRGGVWDHYYGSRKIVTCWHIHIGPTPSVS